MNPLIQGKSGTLPAMSRNAFSSNPGTNEEDSQIDPHPEAAIFGNQTMRNSGQKGRHDMVTGVTEQTRNGHYMVTGATERHYMVTRATKRRDMMTGVHSQPQFLSEKTPATIEADQILLALQQLANNNNSANFPNNIN